MNKDFQILKDDLKALGLQKGDAVLIHSSYKSMGGLEGGIRTLAEALLSVIGDTGTLLSPTLSFGSVTAENPVFDYAKTPSCVGAISEYIRNMDGALRSIHPTHSCSAIGCKSEWYTKGHENDCTPVGENSPFFKLKEDGGKVLMLGCRTTSNTGMHGVEECFGTSYVLSKDMRTYTFILPDRTYQKDYYYHLFRNDSGNRYAQRYDRLEQVIAPGCMPKGLVHGATSWLIDAPAMWKAGLETLAKDELYFVDLISQ